MSVEANLYSAIQAVAASRGQQLSTDPCADVVVPIEGSNELRLPVILLQTAPPPAPVSIKFRWLDETAASMWRYVRESDQQHVAWVSFAGHYSAMLLAQSDELHCVRENTHLIRRIGWFETLSDAKRHVEDVVARCVAEGMELPLAIGVRLGIEVE